MHVDSWPASGAVRYDYFSGRAIEQQHGAITNIFFVHPPCKFNRLHVISFSSYLAHVWNITKTMCVRNTRRDKQVNTKTKREIEAWLCTSSGCVMCISLEGRLKRRFCFPHQRPLAGGLLSISFSLSIPSSLFHE